MNPIKLIKPVNKTAALVTNQAGCSDDITVTYSHLSDYRRIAKELQQAMLLCEDEKERFELGRKLNSVNKLISKKRHEHKHGLKGGVHQCFVDICSKLMSQEDFASVLAQAKAMADKINMK